MRNRWLLLLLAAGLVGCAEGNSSNHSECSSNEECVAMNPQKPICNQGVCVEKTNVVKECTNHSECAQKYTDKKFCSVQGICVASLDENKDVCGDGNITGSETCEPSLQMNKACKDFDSTKTWLSGVPGCDSKTCQLIKGSCSETSDTSEDVCGDGHTTGKEVCDPNETMSKTCSDFDNQKQWESGQPGCNSDCKQLNQGSCTEKSSESVCGTSNAQCDPNAAMAKTCSDFDNTKTWASGGQPGCDNNCKLTKGSCTEQSSGNLCGTSNAQCDPNAAMTKTCSDFDNTKTWEAGGQPGCDNNCKLTQGSCAEATEGYCGDGDVTGNEVCDPNDTMTKTCSDFDNNKTWESNGAPGCDPVQCTLTKGSCTEVSQSGDVCGDGHITGTEQCDPADTTTSLSCIDYNNSKRWTSEGAPLCNSTSCHLEQGTCEEDLCGNGNLDTGELCDFGLNNQNQVITSISCEEYDGKYKDNHNATCKNTCKTLNISDCEEKQTLTGLYYCQLMPPKTVEFSSELTQVTLTGYVAVAGVTNTSTGNDGGVQAQLIYGSEKQDLDTWTPITANPATLSHETIDAYSATFTKNQFEALSAETVYYTFRFRQSDQDEWKYCKANENNYSVINGDIGFLTKNVSTGTFSTANEHNLGVATAVNATNSNVLANFSFDGNYGSTDIYTSYSADEGSAKIQGKNLLCEGNCLANHTPGKAWNVKGFKVAAGTGSEQAEEVGENGDFKHARIVISGISTTGKSNIKMDFDLWRNHINNSPTHVLVYYSVNGGENVYHGYITLETEEKVYHTYTTTFDSSLNDKSSVVFTLIPYGSNNNGSNGAIRFDDIKIYSAN